MNFRSKRTASDPFCQARGVLIGGVRERVGGVWGVDCAGSESVPNEPPIFSSNPESEMS